MGKAFLLNSTVRVDANKRETQTDIQPIGETPEYTPDSKAAEKDFAPETGDVTTEEMTSTDNAQTERQEEAGDLMVNQPEVKKSEEIVQITAKLASIEKNILSLIDSVNALTKVLTIEGEQGDVEELPLAGESKPLKRWIPKVGETRDEFLKRTNMTESGMKYWERVIQPDLKEQLPENFDKF